MSFTVVATGPETPGVKPTEAAAVACITMALVTAKHNVNGSVERQSSITLVRKAGMGVSQLYGSVRGLVGLVGAFSVGLQCGHFVHTGARLEGIPSGCLVGLLHFVEGRRWYNQRSCVTIAAKKAPEFIGAGGAEVAEVEV